MSNNFLVEESLLSGVLSTSCALFNISGSKAKLSFSGTKKIEGIEFYALDHSPKGDGDVDVKLYFGKEDFRHD